jgi:hypothetical protein
MTVQPATFGEFLSAARNHVAAAATAPGTVPLRTVTPGRDVYQQRRALALLVRVLSSYTGDLRVMLRELPSEDLAGTSDWHQAAMQAHDALTNAGSALAVGDHERLDTGDVGSVPAQHLSAAATYLTAGRDLLQGHFTTSASGERLCRSGWAVAVTSRDVCRGLLTEIASLGRQAADAGEAMRAAVAAGSARIQAQEFISTACEWLRLADASVRSAAERVPATRRAARCWPRSR